MAQCIFTNDELDQQTKPEHVLNDALGGRKTTRKAICSRCNNTFGGGIDKALTGQFEIIRNLFQMKSGSGRTAPMLRKLKAGSKTINAHGDGNLELVTKPFEITKHADGRFDLRIMARSLEEIDRLVPHIAAALTLPADNVRQQLANGQAMMVEQRPGVVPFNMTFGGSDALRSAAKSCLVLWALKVGNDEVRGAPYASVRNFILNGDDGFLRMRTQLDTRALSAADSIKETYGPLFNLVYVRSDHAGRVIGHFTIYNMIAVQIMLAEREGAPGQVTALLSNPLDPGVWSDRVATLFDVPFKWLEHPRHDSQEARARFSAAIETYYNLFRPKEIERLSSKVFEKHGLGPNDNIPPELLEETTNELMHRVAHHAVGLPFATPITAEELKRALKLHGKADC